MISRILEKKARELSLKYPVVTITGPRQSGKTTLVQSIFKDHAYFTLENPETRFLVQDDPNGFFTTHQKQKIILDEIQYLPDLLSYIQVFADRDKIMGQFILTGSQSLLLSEKVSQTLAGRTAILKLLPFSLDELIPINAFREFEFEDWIHRGFYPRIYNQNIDPSYFYPFYFETYIQRDVRQFFRDNNRNEVDCILEDATLKALEIKSSRTFSKDFTKGLDFLIRHGDLNPENSYIIYGGNDTFMYKEKTVISWSDLNRLHSPLTPL